MNTVAEAIAIERRHGHRSERSNDARDRRRRSVPSPRRGRDTSSITPSPSPGYVLEWWSGNVKSQQYRHMLSSVEELRSELLAGESAPTQGRILVIRGGHLDEAARDALQSIAGVDAGFIDAHVEGRAYRPWSSRGRRPRWWCWKYPEVARTGIRPSIPPQYRPGEGQILTISRVSLWMGSDIPILFMGHTHVWTPSKMQRSAPTLKHQDAATSQLASVRQGLPSSYGAIGEHYSPTFPPIPPPHHLSSSRRTEMSSFEEDLWETLISVGSGEEVSVEELFGELIHQRWVDCLAAMRLDVVDCEQEQKSLWRAMAALETNLDEARYLSRQGKALDAVCPSAWNELIQRLQVRIQLRQPAVHADIQRKQHHDLLSAPRSDNDQSLDRIAYLGGMLLPVTVVASILAIEGDYGPEGGNFWVFWVASFVASMAAVLVIYADQLRSVEVWFEVGDGEDDVEIAEADSRRPSAAYLVQRWTDGTKGSTWKRKELGWGGAVKKMSGYYRWKADPRLTFRKPGEVLRPKFA